jgi:hypothetical protein
MSDRTEDEILDSDEPVRLSPRGEWETEEEAELRKAKEQIHFGASSIDTPLEAREDRAARAEADRIALAERRGDEDWARYQSDPERIGEAHNRAASDFDVLARKLGSSVGERREKVAKTVREYNGRKIPAGPFAEVREGTAKMLAEDKAARRARKMAKRERRAAQPYVTKELGPYDAGSPHSWVRDTLFARDPSLRGFASGRSSGLSDMSEAAVEGRLQRHGEDVRRAVNRGTKYGRRVQAMMHEQLRCEDVNAHRKRVRELRTRELRSFGTDGGISATAPGEGSAFVPPAILLKSFAEYRTPFASFATQCAAEDLPEWGMEIDVAHVTGAMEVTSQTEGQAVAEKAPTTGLIKGAVVNKSGQLEVSQVWLDRAGPGIKGDAVLFAQLKMQIDTEVDAYALNQALAASQSVSNSTASFEFATASGVGGFVGDVRKAKNLIATTAGTRIKATHLWGPSKFVNYIEAFAMSTGGPVWSPSLDDNRLPIRSEGDMRGEGYSGYLLAQLAVFANDNLPNLGTTSNYQVAIADPSTVLVFRSTPTFYIYPASYANTLDAALGARVYTACVARWPEGVAALSGAMYKSSLFA